VGIAVEVAASIAPIPKDNYKGIIFGLPVGNSVKVPIFAHSLQKRIIFTIYYHGKSL
jgi:hypothetical protein